MSPFPALFTPLLWLPRGMSRPKYELARPALLGGIWCLLVGHAAANNKFGLHVEEAMIDHTPSFFTVGFIILLILACGSSIWAWSMYLDYDPPYEHVRSNLLRILGVFTAYELCLYALGFLQGWTVSVVLLVNSWGMLDAILRFPTVHDLDSLFALKQLLLTVAKVLMYAFGGFINFSENKVTLFACLLGNIVELPLLYFLALPHDEVDGTAEAHNVVDVDLAVRLLCITTNELAREACLLDLKRRVRAAALWCARYNPLCGEALIQADPTFERVFRKVAKT